LTSGKNARRKARVRTLPARRRVASVAPEPLAAAEPGERPAGAAGGGENGRSPGGAAARRAEGGGEKRGRL